MSSALPRKIVIEAAEVLEESPPRTPGAKRLLDVAVAAPLLVLALPILAVLALLVKCLGGGPAFFSQVRLGLGGRRFRVWKLRTMYVDAEPRLQDHLERNPAAAEEWRRSCKLRDDPRVLPVIGRWLRKTSLDELPQLWNVLCGDMSLVGPRPLPEYHIQKFPGWFQALRLTVRPGLTGLWQVRVRSGGAPRVMQFLDSHYIRHWSLALDLWVLMHTLPAVFECRGAC